MSPSTSLPPPRRRWHDAANGSGGSPLRRASRSSIGIAPGQVLLNVVRDTLLEGGERLAIAGGAQSLDARLGEVLIFLHQLQGHVDELDARRAVRSAEQRVRQIEPAARHPGPDVEQTADSGIRQQPRNDGHTILDVDEVTDLAAVG